MANIFLLVFCFLKSRIQFISCFVLLSLIGETIGGSRNEGNSIISEHNSDYGTENSQPPARDDGPRRVLMETKCIDVKKLLTDASKKYEKIVMKLDIESSEYDVLERMIDTETYKFVSEMWVEWHSRYMVEFNSQCCEVGCKIREVYEEREKKIKKFFSNTNVKLNDWH